MTLIMFLYYVILYYAHAIMELIMTDLKSEILILWFHSLVLRLAENEVGVGFMMRNL